MENYPILEFDPDRDAVIHPDFTVKKADIPPCCVLSFFSDVIARMQAEGELEQIAALHMESMELPIYRMKTEHGDVCLVQALVGAAPAAGGELEEMIAYGCNKFIVCGGAGILRKDLAVGHLILPKTAVRDEGLSYHYLPPSREVECDPEAFSVLEACIREEGLPYVVGKTWTTDGFYRETRGKIAHRTEEGCICVEMEAAAFFAVSQYRNVRLAQILYAGDDLTGEQWDNRGWNKRGDIREKLIRLSAEICQKL